MSMTPMGPTKTQQGKEVHQFLSLIHARLLKRFVDAYMSNIDRTSPGGGRQIKRPGRPSIPTRQQEMIPLSQSVFAVIDDEFDTLDQFLLTHPHCQIQPLVLNVVRCILENLKKAQRELRDFLLGDLQSCCRASHEFLTLMERTEEMVLSARSKYSLRSNQHQRQKDSNKSLPEKREEEEEDGNRDKKCGEFFVLDNNVDGILSLFCLDAVFSARMAHTFVLGNISGSIERGLFTRQWEEYQEGRGVNTVAAVSLLIQAVEQQMPDLELFLDNDFLLKKAIDALVSATVILYVRCLVSKAQQRRWRSKSVSIFSDPVRAVARMRADVVSLRSYFTKLVPKMPALLRVVDMEFSFLWAMWEMMAFASGTTSIKVMDSFHTIHRRIGNMDLTSRLVCDLWYVASPSKAHVTWKSLPPSSNGETPSSNGGKIPSSTKSDLMELRLDNTLMSLYGDDVRKSLPIVLPRQLVLGLSSRYYSESKLTATIPLTHSASFPSPRPCALPVHDAVMT